MKIVPELLEHRKAVLWLNRKAFGGDEESNIIEWLDRRKVVLASLVALDEHKIVGHIFFFRIEVEVEGKIVNAAALGSLCVDPARQRQSIGSQLVIAGVEVMRSLGIEAITVLGHATYYPRFGFRHDLVANLSCAINDGEDYMGLELVPEALGGRAGTCTYPLTLWYYNK